MHKACRIVLVLAVMTFFSVLSNAQCQNQGCRRPTTDQPCYGCADLTGYFCNLIGSCPQSCTEGVCPPDTGGGGGGGCCDPVDRIRFTPSPFELKHQLVPRSLMAAVQPQPVACQNLVLP